jgi:hypothetical protein
VMHARARPFAPAESVFRAHRRRPSSKERQWFRTPEIASSPTSTCVRSANSLANIKLRPHARSTSHARVRHRSSSVVIGRHGAETNVRSRSSTRRLAFLEYYPACARGRPLESVGTIVTIRPAFKVRSNVTDSPNIRNCGAIRRSSAEATAGVLGQPGVVKLQ